MAPIKKMTDGMTGDSGHILFFEPRTGGHREEHLQYILDHIANHNSGDQKKYTFVVSTDFVQNQSKTDPSHGKLDSSIRLVPITPDEVRWLEKSGGFLATSRHWKICRRYLNRFKPTHLMLMDLTPLELSLCFARPSCRFSGILFVQYPELRLGSWRKRLKFAVKHLKTCLFLRNPKIHRIFMLNGESSCRYLNNRFKTQRYVPIPDPVPPGEPAAQFLLKEYYGLDADTRIFLFFGSISARKGADVLLDALLGISEETAQKSTFLLCGMPEPGYARHYDKSISRLQKIRPDLKLVCDTRFFQTPEMKAAFQQSDWILMPYIRSEYSSGILAHAAAASTPVIAPDDGLPGRLVSGWQLGRCTQIDPKALATAINGACLNPYSFDEPSRLAFVERSNRFDFARIIMESIYDEGH